MLLASYKSTRPGWQGIANRLIRWRLRGVYSHSEIVFQPWDGVDDLMPAAAPQAGEKGDRLARLAWETAREFERASPTVAGIGAQFGLDDAQLDALFTAAAQIKA